MVEINLMEKYPKTKRDLNQRALERTSEDIKIAKEFGKEFFDGNRKQGYGGYFYHPRYWGNVVKDFIKYYRLTKDSKILDVGCGKGFLLYDLIKALPGITIKGIDISQYAIENGIEEVKSFLSVGNAKDLSQFKDKEFDLVISINTVHNLDLEDCKQAIREIERVGKNAFIVNDAWRNDKEKKGMLMWNLTGVTFMHVNDWKKLFEEVGYTGDYYWFIPELIESKKIMKAAVLCETNQPLQVQELEVPPLNPGQVLVKIFYAGLCRSQLNEISAHKGPDKYLPHTLGHEASGIVEDVGHNVTKVKPGDYVVLSWIKGEGMDVSNCQYKRVSDGIRINSGPITVFNQYSIVSENRVVKIPSTVPPKIATLLGCAAPTGLGIIKNELKVQEGQTIAIFGMGGIGSAVLLGATNSKLSKIIAIDVNDKKLELALEIGATHIINSSREDVIEKINLITNSELVDFSVDCIGIPKVTETAFEIIKDKGTTIIVGNAKKDEKISLTPFDFIKGKKLFGSWGGATKPDQDLPHYIQQYLQGDLPLEKLITETYPLEQINNAISDLKEGKVIRALIKISNP